MPLPTGLVGSAELKVADADTAVALHSGDVLVLGTPRLVALAEEATIVAVADALGPGETTVGMRVQLDHLSPSPVGSMVTAEASLDRVEGRRLVFNVSVRDERGLVAAGKITRVVVDRQRFMEKAR
jgi:predicted thioesterase